MTKPATAQKALKLANDPLICETNVSCYRCSVEETHDLDEVDRRIVRALQRDASLSQAALAEAVGASPASVWRRVRALERAGVLGATVRLASAEALGRSVNVLCQVRMVRQSIEARAEFEAFIQSRAEIVECYSMSGEWDYLLRIAVRDVADYDRFIMRGVLAHPSVANAASNFALRQVKYTTEIPL
jgi:DNA-binding Lrp family transcriptional regulator